MYDALSDYEQLHVRIEAAASRLTIRPGGGDAFISGTYSDPSGQIPLRLSQDGDTVRIAMVKEVSDALHLLQGIPHLELELGNRMPLTLSVETGASSDRFDLGGLPLRKLHITNGAGKTEVDFSAPNPETLTLLKLNLGAGSIDIRELANANFVEMRVDGGVGSYTLDFAGEARQDGSVRIGAGVVSVELEIPSSTAAVVTSSHLLGTPQAADGFTRRDDGYWTQAAVEGQTPLFRIHSSVAIGALQLRTSHPEPVE
jgi:hypothetical protein